MDSNNKIYLKQGLAVDAQGRPVTQIDADSCNCGIDTCDCAIIMTDLVTPANKFVLVVLGGELAIATYANFLTYKASGDTDDLSAIVVGTQS